VKVALKVPNPSKKSWTVKGKNLEEVFDNLNKNAFWGRYRSNHKYKSSGKGDKIDTVTLESGPVITMPAWGGYSKATKDEKKSWDTMFKALQKHENNHHDIFVKAAEDFKKEMERGGDLTEREVERAWSAFDSATQKLQDKYDSTTDHGKKEGVILDIP
jgi:predicted secreted Zn-dependent protease